MLFFSGEMFVLKILKILKELNNYEYGDIMGLFDRFKKNKAIENNNIKNVTVESNESSNNKIKPKWQHENPEVRLEAVKELDDQKILIDIAKNDLDEDVREEAVLKINDEAVLIDIAKNDEGFCVRKEAIYKITDESVIIDILKNDPRSDIRGVCIRNINDVSVLMDVARNDSYKDNRIAAAIKVGIKNIDDESILIDVAKDAYSWEDRLAAVKKIKDVNVLIDIANNDNTSDVRLEATRRVIEIEPMSVKKIDYEAGLIYIAQHDSYKISEVAKERLKDYQCYKCGKKFDYKPTGFCPDCGGRVGLSTENK